MKFKIYWFPAIEGHAKRLLQILTELGYSAELTREVDHTSPDIYILYASHQIRFLPKFFIVYQIEQWSSHWFSEHYWNTMVDAMQVWEFSQDNILKYESKFMDKVQFVPPGYTPPIHSHFKDVDVLFYGSLNNHRSEIIGYLRDWFDIKVVDNLYGDKMVSQICRAKVVLNLHFYKGAALEVFRINEALSCGVQVVSEKVSGGHYPDVYNQLIRFANNMTSLKWELKNAMASPKPIDLSLIDNKDFVKQAIEKL
jgi:hypothetical protein